MLIYKCRRDTAKIAQSHVAYRRKTAGKIHYYALK